MTRDELLGLLARLRRATVGGIRAPRKPLLLLWLLGGSLPLAAAQRPTRRPGSRSAR